MSQPGKTLSFEQWIDYVFDRPVTDPQWYFNVDAAGNEGDWWRGDARTIVEYCTRLFESPSDLAQRFSREQLAQGFWYIVSNGASDYMFALRDESVPWPNRRRCIGSIVTLFERFFAGECRDELGHLQRSGQHNDPLTTTCYMWWDLFPGWIAPGEPHHAECVQGIFEAMEAILELPSETCMESALHGLGHAAPGGPDRVRSAIDRFLAQHPHISPELRRYALSARSGCVQ